MFGSGTYLQVGIRDNSFFHMLPLSFPARLSRELVGPPSFLPPTVVNFPSAITRAESLLWQSGGCGSESYECTLVESTLLK